MTKGIIYYTDGRLAEPILSTVQNQILKANLPITSVSLNRPIDFGKNIVLNLEPSVYTMYIQILTALENSDTDIIFFCEHDVLYHLSHFDFIPPSKEIYYYNSNVWRWRYPDDFAITYTMASLSNMCTYRETAINHYRYRINKIKRHKWDKIDEREPYWSRLIGHEPGTKKRRKGGITNEEHILWRAEYPNIDIRHSGTLTKTKTSLREFKHKPNPNDWKETTLNKIEGWKDIRKMFMVTPLCQLAYKYGTDKCQGIGTLPHSYTPFYYELLKDKQNSIKKVLELGTGTPKTMRIDGYVTGAGLRMWRDFFPNAQIYGADILRDSVFKEDRIESFLCDLSKEKHLLELIAKTGTDIDLVIDDASHEINDVVLAVLTLMPLLKKDVIYVIEDIKYFLSIRKILQPYYNLYEPTLIDKTSRRDRLVIVSRKENNETSSR